MLTSPPPLSFSAPLQANSTSATFLRVVGSELIQKYLGDGPKLVRELFKAADEMAPSIVFIDEVDAIGTKRYDSQSGGEREIQRTMLEVRTLSFRPFFSVISPFFSLYTFAWDFFRWARRAKPRFNKQR